MLFGKLFYRSKLWKWLRIRIFQYLILRSYAKSRILIKSGQNSEENRKKFGGKEWRYC